MTRKLTPEQLGTYLLREQFRRVGQTIESVKKMQADGVDWLHVIRWPTEADHDSFIQWATDETVRLSKLKPTRKAAAQSLVWFDLGQGLMTGPCKRSVCEEHNKLPIADRQS